jgi:tripartite-type tricarboxylate transporter receptor subunit TctC
MRSLARLLVLAFIALAAHAQSWPDGPLRLIVPYGPGSTPDIVARLVAEPLGARLGKPVVVENKAGAAGNIGTDAVAKAVPDGQTFGLSISGPLAVNPMLFRKMPYDPARDLVPVTIAATQPSVVVVSSALGISSARELIERLKSEPGRYNYSSMGGGTISHLAMEALATASGTTLVHVPYSGSAAAVLALLSGDVQIACLPAAAVMPQVKAGKLKALAVATQKRSPSLPELPTLEEAGLHGVSGDAWMGFIVPAGTPAPIVTRLHDDIVAILRDPAMREKLRTQYMDVVAGSQGEFRAVLEADARRWKPIIDKNHITLD